MIRVPHMRGVARALLGTALGWTVLCGGAATATANEGDMCAICRKANKETVAYPTKAGYTLVRGATNTVFGWTEVIRQPALEAKGGGNVFVGIGKGVGYGVERTLAGVGEILTFWMPKVQHHYLHLAHDCPLCMKRAQQSSAPPQ